MKVMTQLELIDLLESNPLKIPVYFNEVTVPDAKDYIFLDAIGDAPIKSDNKADYVQNVQIQVYSDSIDDLNITLSFIKTFFTASIDRYKEDNYNVASMIPQLKITDWS